MLGTQQLCGGYGFVLPPLCFRFTAFLLKSEQFYLTTAPQQLPLHANWVHRGASVGQPEGKKGLRGEKGEWCKPAGNEEKIPKIECHDE